MQKPEISPDSPSDSNRQSAGDDVFPETSASVLQRAAGGDWREFFESYLKPCWREIIVRCRVSNLPLGNADDLFQELAVRLIREGRLGHFAQEAQQLAGGDAGFRGNTAARYLLTKQLPEASPRFRTYLKSVIRNVIFESIQRQYREPRPLAFGEQIADEPWVDATIDESLERQWATECLDTAVLQLLEDSRQAVTKGRRRLFDILYLEVVEGFAQADIAAALSLHPSTVSDLRRAARVRFVRILQEITGVADLAELREIVAGTTDTLRLAFQRVKASVGEQ